MRPHTADDIEYDLNLLYLYEIEGLSQPEIARREGISQGHLSRRLARARRYREERRRAEEREHAILTRDKDKLDYEYMELSDMPTGNRAFGRPIPFCSEETLAPGGKDLVCSESSGTYHVGGRVRSLTRGVQTTDEGGPTSYSPDPDGLKGGVG